MCASSPWACLSRLASSTSSSTQLFDASSSSPRGECHWDIPTRAVHQLGQCQDALRLVQRQRDKGHKTVVLDDLRQLVM